MTPAVDDVRAVTIGSTGVTVDVQNEWTALLDQWNARAADCLSKPKTSPIAATYTVEFSGGRLDYGVDCQFLELHRPRVFIGSAATTRVSDSKLIALIDGLARLRAEDSADLPSAFAFENALCVVASALALARAEKPSAYLGLPDPAFGTDNLGGVRLAWVKNGRELRANFGGQPDLRSYLYHQAGFEHDIEKLETESLLARLYWLTAD